MTDNVTDKETGKMGLKPIGLKPLTTRAHREAPTVVLSDVEAAYRNGWTGHPVRDLRERSRGARRRPVPGLIVGQGEEARYGISFNIGAGCVAVWDGGWSVVEDKPEAIIPIIVRSILGGSLQEDWTNLYSTVLGIEPEGK